MKEITVKLSDAQYNKFKVYCDRNDINPSELLRIYIAQEYCDEKIIKYTNDFPQKIYFEDNIFSLSTITNAGASYHLSSGSFKYDSYIYIEVNGKVSYRILDSQGNYVCSKYFARFAKGKIILDIM